MRVYTYTQCSTCRKAVKWLQEQGIRFEEIPIREQPPSPEELRRMLSFQEGEIKRLFNTSGGDYRELQLGRRLPSLSVDEAIALLAAKGNLVKRPFLLSKHGGLVGFKPEEWERFFASPQGPG